MQKILYKFLFLCCAMFSITGAASAKTMEFCNNSGGKAWFGYAAYRGVTDKWQSKGRFQVETANCRTIEIGDVSGKVYVWAEGEDGHFGGMAWGGTTEFCTKSSSFEINDARQDEEGGCGAGQRRKWGTPVTEASGKYRWNITRANVISSHYTICNQSGQKVRYSQAQLKYRKDNWHTEGWSTLEHGACKDVRVHSERDLNPSVTSSNGLHLFGRSDDGRLIWNGGDSSFCFDLDSNHDFDNANTMACSGTERGKAKFVTLPVAPGFKTFTFAATNSAPRRSYVKYCNQTNTRISLARATYQGTWKSNGWYHIAANSCLEKEVPAAAKSGESYKFGYTGTLYYAAYSENKELNWAKENGREFCVSSSAFSLPEGDCSGEDQMRYSFQDHAVVPGTQTVNFHGNNAMAKTKLKLCNDNDFSIFTAYAGTIKQPNSVIKSAHGYYEVTPRACREITLWRTDNLPASGAFDVYAFDRFRGDWSWGNGSREMCIATNDTFHFEWSDMKPCTAANEVKVRTMPVSLQYGRNELHFSASNANKKTIVEYCNRTPTPITLYDVTTISRNGPNRDVAGPRSQPRGSVAPGACVKKTIMDYNGSAYAGPYAYYASSISGSRWTGPNLYCLSTGSLARADTGCTNAVKVGFRTAPALVQGTTPRINLELPNADPTTYSFCNRTPQTVTAAVAYEYNGNLISIGLGTLTPGACLTKNLINSEGNPVFGRIYLYAKGSDGTVYARGTKDICIASDPTQTVSTPVSAACSGDQRLVKMKSASGRASLANELNFSEADALGKTSLTLCNRSGEPIKAAYAWYKNAADGFTGQGWIDLAPDACETIRLAPDADAAYEGNVLVYAEGSALENFGSGPLRFCVNTLDANWVLPQADHAECRNRSLKRVDAELISIDAMESRIFDFGNGTAPDVD